MHEVDVPGESVSMSIGWRGVPTEVPNTADPVEHGTLMWIACSGCDRSMTRSIAPSPSVSLASAEPPGCPIYAAGVVF